ncbi:hypothetical protein [Photobacterium kishitanii]|uniref:Uncharacterized protein n=1 Tax=Photobacterium kishitanii TaxID=318456 RepID=A0A2T3KM43_9GAMM|nr:hypothetical protein [Photobacterium kishitanii]PSV00870.1 hypothetical protein C9J27_02255 [Photobacterium kishitanii]
MSSSTPVVRNKTVSFRDGDHTSKVTIQPAIYEALARHFGDDKDAYTFISGLAIQAHQARQKKISGYIQDYILDLVFPNNLTDGYLPSGDRVEVRIFDPVHNRPTKLITFGALSYALDKLSDGNSSKIYNSTAAAYMKKVAGKERGRDLSFEVREELIRGVFEG